MNSKFKKHIKLVVTFCFIFALIFAQAAFAQTSLTEGIQGDDSCKASVESSQKNWKTSNYAVLTSADSFADTLCSGPLADEYNCPLLLTNPDQLNPDTLNELKRLEVKHLFIIGGTGAVSQNVEAAVKTAGITDIQRIWGESRYETSVKIAEKLGDCNTIYLATGNKSSAAYNASVTASNTRIPVLLTAKDSLPACVVQYIQGKSIVQTYIIGGPEEISTEVENLLPGATRLTGNQ